MKSHKSVSLILGIIILSVVFSLASTAGPVMAADKDEAQAIVDKAKGTLETFLSDKDYSWVNEHINKVKGVLIYPQVLKAGFFLGGSGGTGVFLARDAKGEWSQPAFYTMGSVSFGLQIGGEAAEVIVLCMNQKAVDALMTTKVKFGGDTSIALGPVGAGAKSNVVADFISFAKSKGLYAGLNLDGSVVDVREGLNQAYYGKSLTPIQIVVEKKATNPGSSALRATLKKAK
ncbi:MAG TPA: lipid-binding SYLF domain-containing protein [Thermodesulfobacteriota bacterium]|nr:lipid-binding SYLF domain-containing protein [Thermodesulfobacteriota bacterium]